MARTNNDNIANGLETAFRNELEKRLSILSPDGRDIAPPVNFNKVDYFLMVLFGIAVPIAVMVWGWH